MSVATHVRAHEGRTICWFSCGAASAVATHMTLRRVPAAVVAYCETGAEHPDNERFMADVARWIDAPVTRLRSDKYETTWDVWERTRWLAGIEGARCTTELKVLPRLSFQNPYDVHVFGYTADKTDMKRAAGMRERFPEMTIKTPLIDAGLTKQNVLAIIQSAGIALPPMYAMGFHNNNCIPCPKATSPDYWSLVRERFPAEFSRMATLSRELGVRLTRIGNERRFIDDIPEDWPTTNPIQPACDFVCQWAEEAEAAE